MLTAGRIKRFLFTAIVIGVGLVVAVFMGYRQYTEPETLMMTNLSDNADIVVNRVRQTSIKDGVIQWRLKADSARYIESNDRAIFEGIALVFFAQDGKPVNLSATHGNLNIASSNIDLAGNVVVDYGGATLKTQAIQYQHQNRMIRSQTPVQILSQQLKVLADRAEVDLVNRRTRLTGNVKGTLFEQILL